MTACLVEKNQVHSAFVLMFHVNFMSAKTITLLSFVFGIDLAVHKDICLYKFLLAFVLALS